MKQMNPEEIRRRIAALVPADVLAAHVRRGRAAADGRVVVAMSGGVDSSVAAALACAAGCEVVGVSMRLAPDGGEAQGGCCSLEDFEDARRVADVLGFPHYVIDFRDAFRSSVVEPFVAAYLAGRTPNPCALCNRELKFDALWNFAETLGALALATGHYAGIRETEAGVPELRMAADPDKDQSYFLFELASEALSRTLFPLGALRKGDVREIAGRLLLPVAEKPESQDICFVGKEGYGALVERLAASDQVRSGVVVDEAGAVIGSHAGVHKFTIGQRRGLPGGSLEPRYVTEIDAGTGVVHCGPRAGLERKSVAVSRVTRQNTEDGGEDLQVRVRHRHPLVPCRIGGVDESGRLRIDFERPIIGVAPGQAAVWYRGDTVVGGGWIEGTFDG